MVMTIGILGGGQLGRMLALAAARLGFKTHIFCPDPLSPAFDVTRNHTCAAYDDLDALASFADAVDVITYEFENIPDETVDFLAARKPLAPNAQALRVSQDRLLEKAFLVDYVDVAPFAPVTSAADLDGAIETIGLPAVLKTTRFGYDGKGQRTLRTSADAKAGLKVLAGQQLVLEGFVTFSREISVIVARNAHDDCRAFDPAENVHTNHILDTSTVPANVDPAVAERARDIAEKIARALDYVGVMGIEFFVVGDGAEAKLLVNEIAPRVHNSGHWTEAVCITDQFEQHIRAIAGLPLGDPKRFADVTMKNLIGDDILNLFEPHKNGSGRPHHYGKLESRFGRKMGHVNYINSKKLN